MGPGPVWTCTENLAPTGIRSPVTTGRGESHQKIKESLYFYSGSVAELKLYRVQKTYFRLVAHWLRVLDGSHKYTNRTVLSSYLAPPDCVV